MQALGSLHARGSEVVWPVLGRAPRPSHHIDLPTYAFHRRRYWLDATDTGTGPSAGDRTPAPDQSFWSAVEGEDLDALARTLGVDADQQGALLAEFVPMLSGWRRRSRERSALQDLRYTVAWRPVPEPDATPTGSWLVVTAQGSAADTCIEALERQGVDILRADVTGHDPDTMTDRLRDALPATEPRGVQGVLSLLALADEPHRSEALTATYALVRALGELGVGAPLWCATQGAVALSADRGIRPDQAGIWGLGRVVGLEHPERWGGLVDLPAEIEERAATLLRAVLSGATGEDQVAVRPGGLLARRLTRSARTGSGTASEWTTKGTALITGGTGALGAHAARWLVRAGAEHLVLTSRRGLDAPGAAALRDELTALGAKVTIAACDAADREALDALVDRLADEGVAINAVVHTAGVAQSNRIEETGLDEMADVYGGKAEGARNLDEVFADTELDAFILFASTAGVWGGAGQGAYGAANAYLDALAERRRLRGLTATSIAWGPWAGGGMTARDDAEAHLRRRGVSPVTPESALTLLQQAMEHDETLVTVADVDWNRFAASFTAVRPSTLFDEIPEARQAQAPAPATQGTPAAAPLGERLAGLSSAERQQALVELVRTHAAAVLGYPDADGVEAGKPFRDLGFDSLAAVDFRNRLNEALGLSLPATSVFDHPTPREFAAYLRPMLGEDELSEGAVLAEIDKLESKLAAVAAGAGTPDIAARLEALLARWGVGTGETADAEAVENLQSATRDEVFDFIDNELGI
ncbi:SDR family NAD(P)-dependent oxidoreductase [Streptomyces sp. NPDC052101]|uniref:SDR family NAD(P)-dependent oxidoreductase n=1 Tax=Streptomyces sp. NPDC052101 TaxID=3155763 RepID=UPI00342BEEAF